MFKICSPAKANAETTHEAHAKLNINQKYYAPNEMSCIF
jgi:hypothetical protein